MAYHHSQEMFEKLGIVPTTVALLSPTAPDGSVATVTDDPENPIYIRQGGVWVPSSSATNLTTFEALTFPVDYNDPTAVDPPTSMVFTRQAEITAFLAGAGTSNFKHLQAAWNRTAPSLPPPARRRIRLRLDRLALQRREMRTHLPQSGLCRRDRRLPARTRVSIPDRTRRLLLGAAVDSRQRGTPRDRFLSDRDRRRVGRRQPRRRCCADGT